MDRNFCSQSDRVFILSSVGSSLRLEPTDKFCFDKFLHRIEVIDLNSDKTELLDEIIRLRQQYHLKLPDTIIAGTAIFANAVLITGDKQLLKIRELKILDFT